jgi:PST family polysaccharide transporter
MLRLKVAAVLLGPAGVGLIGLFQNLTTAAAGVGSLGISNAATRQIAEASSEAESSALAEARRALAWAGFTLSVLSGLVMWLFCRQISIAVTGSPALSTSVAWLGVGVSCAVAGMAQVALLTGLRRIGDVARVTTYAGVLGTLVAVAGLFAFGDGGLLLFVISPAVAALLVGQFYVMKLPRSSGPAGLRGTSRQLKALSALGFVIMIGGLSAQVSQLAIRALIQRDLGLVDLGYFQAAVSLGVTYIGFVLAAMGADYYPRLTSAMRDKEAACRIVNEQTEVALMLAGPLLVIMMGMAPWLLHALYAAEFTAAAPILRWQVLGDFFKLCGWPLGFVMLAAGRGKTYMLIEFGAAAVAVATVWIALPIVGIEASGLASLTCYAWYMPTAYLLARRQTGFRWSRRALISMAIVASACLSVFLAAGVDERLGALASAVCTPLMLLYAWRSIGSAVGGEVLARIRRKFGAA